MIRKIRNFVQVVISLIELGTTLGQKTKVAPPNFFEGATFHLQ
jgi:hypothetical protein